MIDFHDRRQPNFDSYYDPPEYEEPRQPRCSSCGAFLPFTPDRREPWEETVACDGSVTEVLVTPEGALADIIGTEPYREFYSACGLVGGQHEPHVEVLAADVSYAWTCRRCGRETRDG